MANLRIHLPYHLRMLARDAAEASSSISSQPVAREVMIEVSPPITVARVLETLEARFPSLRGTIRDGASGQRRAFVRFFVAGADWSNQPADTPLPDSVVAGSEPFMVIGALAGG